MAYGIIRTRSAGGVVVNHDGLVLVVNQNGESWSLPKGHIEEGESEFEAAKREIYEESGVRNLLLEKELGCYQRYRIGKNGGDDKTDLKTICMFLFRTEDFALNPIDPNTFEAKWLEKEKVTELLTHSKDKKFFQSIIGEL